MEDPKYFPKCKSIRIEIFLKIFNIITFINIFEEERI